MKKILMAATAALALAGNPVIAQEDAGGGQDSSDSALLVVLSYRHYRGWCSRLSYRSGNSI